MPGALPGFLKKKPELRRLHGGKSIREKMTQKTKSEQFLPVSFFNIMTSG